MGSFLAPALVLLLAGCAQLPDTRPFTDATLSLRKAVASSGTAVVTELGRTPIEGVKEQAKKVETAWKEQNQLFAALVEYANSLQSIVDSGKRGAAAANTLADSVGKLAKAADIAQPGAGETGAVVTEVAAFVYGHIAKARAARSLERALIEVQPAIERIAQVMASQLQKLDELVRVACQAQQSGIEIENQSHLSYRNSLVTSRLKLMDQLRSELASNKKPSELTQANEIRRLDELIAATDSWDRAFQTQLKTITERERLARQLIAETRSAFADWTAAHARMLAAVRTKRVLSASELTETAERIRKLIERFENR